MIVVQNAVKFTPENGEIHVWMNEKCLDDSTSLLEFRCKDNRNQQISLEGLCVLVAEDNDLNMEIVEYMLERNGIQVVCAKDGQEVIDLFEKSEVNEFDFILMDIMMPKLNGLDATRKIRSLKRQDAKTVPIIAMSANAFVEDIMNSKIAGMNMHLAKPLDETKLINALKQCKKDEDFK